VKDYATFCTVTEPAASSPAAPTVPNTRAVVSFLAPHAGGAWRWFAGQAAFDALSIVVGLATPALAAVAIDQAIEGRIGRGFFLLAAALALSWLIGVAAPPVATRFSIALGRSLTQRSVDHALDIGLPGRRPFNDGDLLLRAASLAPGMPGYATVMLRVGTGLTMAIGSLVALFVIHWLFVLVLLAVTGLLALGARRLVAVLTAEQSEYETLSASMINAYADALAGRRTIRAAGTLEREIERVTKPLTALVATGRNILRTMGRGAAALASADHGVLVIAASAGIWLLAVGDLTAGAMLAAVRYSQLAYGNLGSVFDNGWFQIAPLRAQAAKVMELLNAPPANPSGDARRRDGDAGEVTLEEVSVRGGESDILRDVNLDIPRGATIAVVGRSGVGKTTLGALVGRLFDPDAGEVRISGTPLPGWSAQTLAQTVAYAFERPALLGDTIRDAIALGREGDNDDVQSAARSVEAHGFIARLPQGYQTRLEDAPMSGGELQRIGLARAALGNPPVLVLDDALSSLDVATAARVFAALRSLSTSRTTLVIAHRASTAAAADVVAWLVDGRIERLAPHGELWRDPAYRAAFVAVGADVESQETTG